MNKQKKPPIPISGVVYGEIIYWCTCVSALVVLFGTIKSFLEVDQTIPVEYLLNAVFEGAFGRGCVGWVSASKVSRCVNLFGDVEFR